MDNLPVYLFKDSFGPFLGLLNEHKVQYKLRANRANVPIAAGEALEIIKVVGSLTFWPSIAVVVSAFVKAKRGRKVIITTEGDQVVHAEGLSPKELEAVLLIARSITAMSPSSGDAGSGTSDEI